MGEELILIGVLAFVCGALLTYLWLVGERRRTQVPPEQPPLVPPGADSVLAVLSSSAVLIGADETVVKASAPAYALGIVRDDKLAIDGMLELVRQVRRDGQVRDQDFTMQPNRGATRHIRARVAQLNSQLVLVLAEDRTDAARVEAIRRDFVANVSHELKTPIGALNLLAEAVSEARDDPEAVARFSARMQTESERLTRLVQQIIDLSRLQHDVLSDEASTIKVDELVQEACEHSETEAEAKQIEISCHIEPGLAIHGDRSELHAAMSNLVENAVTYSPEGSKVAVTAERNTDVIAITVKDNGIGIPTADLDRIFERFYRVDPARARSTGGTGLGLSIVKHVAASNGGTVEVWSEPGVGSSFTLVLPSYPADIEEESA